MFKFLIWLRFGGLSGFFFEGLGIFDEVVYIDILVIFLFVERTSGS